MEIITYLGIRIDNGVKDNKKDNTFFLSKTENPKTLKPQTPSLEERQDYEWHRKNNPKGIPLNLQWISDFLSNLEHHNVID